MIAVSLLMMKAAPFFTCSPFFYTYCSTFSACTGRVKANVKRENAIARVVADMGIHRKGKLEFIKFFCKINLIFL